MVVVVVGVVVVVVVVVVLWSFSGDAIKFIRHQTVLSGLTYLSRHTVTYLSVRMRSVT